MKTVLILIGILLLFFGCTQNQSGSNAPPSDTIAPQEPGGETQPEPSFDSAFEDDGLDEALQELEQVE